MRTINVCIGDSCHSKGSYDLVRRFQNLIEKYQIENIEVNTILCMGACEKAISCSFDDDPEVLSVGMLDAENLFVKKFL